MTTTATAGKPSRFDIPFLMIVTRRRRMIGLGLDELVLVGLWDGPDGRRRRTELVRLGCAHSVAQALGHAEDGMGRYEPGTHLHRRFRDWHRNLRRAERAVALCEARYKALVRAHCAGLPEHDPLATAAE